MMAESRMNLAALQQRDPFITEIVDTASQVALYSFSSKTNEWEKTSIEGTLFIYERSAAPLFGFMILNRLGLQNLIEPFTKTLEFQVQEPFLLYRNAKNIYGIWFYDKDECTRLGTLMNKIVQTISSSEYVSPISHIRLPIQPIHPSQPSPVSATSVDIMKILTKAQHEYDKSKSTVVKCSEPKSMTDNLSSGIETREQPLVRPTPVKYDSNSSTISVKSPAPSSDSKLMSIEALFRKASIGHQSFGTELPDVTKPSALERCISQTDSNSKQDLHPLLMQLVNKTPTLEQIEREQHSDIKDRTTCENYDETGVSPQSDPDSNVFFKSTELIVSPLQPVFPHHTSSIKFEKEISSSVSCPDVLLSPMAFTKPNNPIPSSASLNITSSDHGLSECSEYEESNLSVAALTKQQLQQAFLYLLKKDDGFMTELHKAYLKSLQELTKKSEQ